MSNELDDMTTSGVPLAVDKLFKKASIFKLVVFFPKTTILKF